MQTAGIKSGQRGETAFSSSPRPRRNVWIKMMMKHWQLYLLLLVPLAFVVIFNYVPMYGVIIAFKNFNVHKGMWGSPWVGLKYFRQFFGQPDSMSIIWNTIIFSLYLIVASFPFSILLAISLNEVNNKKFKKTIQMVTYAPYFISTVVLVSMIISFLDPSIGIINRLFGIFGVPPQPYISQQANFIHLYVWSGVWQGMGYGAVLYLAALSSVPQELYEAVKIDGANRWQKIWYLDLPFILPTATIILILNFGQLMNVGFEKVYLMQNPGNIAASEVISTYVYKMGLVNMNMSFATAVNLFNSVVNMILIILVNRVANRMSETSLF